MRIEDSALEIKSKLKDYKAYFAPDAAFISALAAMPNAVFIIDENVWALHKESALFPLKDAPKIILKISEELKNLDSVALLYEEVMRFSPKKNMTVVSIGGGITQDITGFLADTLYRGINWVFVPTTLLAQCDSCIGAKTSLNFKKYKNLLGTFYPPSEIYIYPGFLQTLKEEDYYSGIGESAKLHIIGGEGDCKDFASYLDKFKTREGAALLKSTKRALDIKKEFIESDEFDTGVRNILNYGHCFGHAAEYASSYAVPHGQAVVAGMVVANALSVNLGLLSEEKHKYLAGNVLLPVLKTDLSKIELKADDILSAMKQDKKNTGSGLAVILLRDDWTFVKKTDVTKEQALAALKQSAEVLKWRIS